MKFSYRLDRLSGWRWHFEISPACKAICLWVPWRHPSKPVLYWWKATPSDEALADVILHLEKLNVLLEKLQDDFKRLNDDKLEAVRGRNAGWADNTPSA